ncbi:precorrin-6A reductase [Bengtsoniella intestinalis]|uniref:precorrin-6A reductase n=1 Tax=Bengtsoniella intestinalis TaxID=3073143 RepID=UPI00391F10C4
MKVLLFGGTTEGRLFGEWLASRGIATTICVATQYGGSLLSQEVDVRVGRMNRQEMEALMSQGYTHVVDATHPYAVVVTACIQEAVATMKLPYFRLLRDGAPEGDWIHTNSIAQAAQVCAGLSGSILLTTGSKELEPFSVEGLVERTYPRVLPTMDSLERCLSFGFPVGHILCMTGPFSQQLNEALLTQYDAKLLVTKVSGGVGGFWEKVQAAKACHATLVVIDRPVAETGYSLKELQSLGNL